MSRTAKQQSQRRATTKDARALTGESSSQSPGPNPDDPAFGWDKLPNRAMMGLHEPADRGEGINH